MTSDFYCDEALSGRTPVEIESEYDACRVVTNLGAYQDSKHLHFYVASGDILEPGSAQMMEPSSKWMGCVRALPGEASTKCSAHVRKTKLRNHVEKS